MRQALVGCAVAVLAAAGCSGSNEGSDPTTAATVTVTASPADDADVDLIHPTAQDLLDAAVSAGLSCPNPAPAPGGTEAVDDLTCSPGSSNNRIFLRLFDSEEAFQSDMRAFKRSAQYFLDTGKEPVNVLYNRNGVDYTYWFVGGPTPLLKMLEVDLGGQLRVFGGQPDTEPRPESQAPTPTPTPTKPAPPPVPISFGDGTYLIGEDVQAGMYRNNGDTYNGQAPCVAFTSTKPNDLGTYISGSTLSGPGIIQLSVGQYVTATGCQTWTIDR